MRPATPKLGNALASLGCLALISLMLAGCGRDFGGRKEVSGTVKLKGEPVNDGTIEFIPLSGNAETKSGAQILNGDYKIGAEFGLVPGKYRVAITAGDGRTSAANPEEPPGPTGANIVSKDRVPKEYNIESKQEVEVTAAGKNVFNYDIP